MGDSHTSPFRRASLLVVTAYLVLLALAFLWSYLRNDRSLWCSLDVSPMEFQWAVFIGTIAGLLVVSLSRLAVEVFPWARRLEQEFAKILGPLSILEVMLLSATSSVAEEAFFRGALQPSLGLTLTSLVFGLLHIGPSRVFLPWTAMALAMGFALGGLFLWTGSLLAPILCHLVVNTLNLRHIVLRGRWMPSEPEPPPEN